MPDQPFQPNWASPIGETVSRLMQRADLDTLDLANRLDITISEVRGLLSGSSPLSEQRAQALGEVLGGSTAYWLNRDRYFRDSVARIPIERRYDPDWVASFPIGDLSKFGWIGPSTNEAERASQLLEFFGISLSAQWKFRYPEASSVSAFRTSHALNTRHEAVASWLRQGEKIAAGIACARWNRDLFISRLGEARALTRNRHPLRFFPELRKLCADCGVALVAVPTPSTTSEVPGSV